MDVGRKERKKKVGLPGWRGVNLQSLKKKLVHLMQFITTVPMLTIENKQNRHNIVIEKAEVLPFTMILSPLSSISVVGGSGKASDNMT